MAPVGLSAEVVASDLTVSSLELDRRASPADLPSYLALLSLAERKQLDTPRPFARRSLDTFSPLTAAADLLARDPASTPQHNPGQGTISPTSINNAGVLALFAILSGALVLASIWFFFWAKNGSFRWRKGDWEDYKSTVLRRKGPDGKLLSNATRSTNLGGGSIVAETNRDDDFLSSVAEKAPRHKRGKKHEKKERHNRDEDVRAYRHEKPARVGGLNREADGSYYDYSTTDPSDIATSYHHQHHHHQKTNTKDKKKPSPTTPNNKKNRQFSYNAGTESTFSVYSDDSHRPLRSSPAHHRHSVQSSPIQTPSRSRQPSPIKHSQHTPSRSHRRSGNPRSSVPGSSYTDPIDFESRYTASEADTEQTRNTKTYFHPLPGLSQGGGNGFRRGGGRRRDSLSDSEGETGTARS